MAFRIEWPYIQVSLVNPKVALIIQRRMWSSGIWRREKYPRSQRSSSSRTLISYTVNLTLSRLMGCVSEKISNPLNVNIEATSKRPNWLGMGDGQVFSGLCDWNEISHYIKDVLWRSMPGRSRSGIKAKCCKIGISISDRGKMLFFFLLFRYVQHGLAVPTQKALGRRVLNVTRSIWHHEWEKRELLVKLQQELHWICKFEETWESSMLLTRRSTNTQSETGGVQ